MNMSFISNIYKYKFKKKLIIIYIYYYINKHVRQLDDQFFFLIKVTVK